jgi:hypothetical protein
VLVRCLMYLTVWTVLDARDALERWLLRTVPCVTIGFFIVKAPRIDKSNRLSIQIGPYCWQSRGVGGRGGGAKVMSLRGHK